MKRIISTLLCMIILINFIFTSCSYAETPEPKIDGSAMPSIGTETMNYSNNVINDLTYEGKTSDQITGKASDYNIFTAIGGGVVGALVGIVCMVIDIVPLTAEVILTIVTATGTDAINSITSKTNTFAFSIEKTVFNEIGLFNVDFFNFKEKVQKFNFFGLFGSTTEDDTVEVPEYAIQIKESIAKWFYICRIIATATSVLVLIYVGIMMAVSTVASDRAKYKKMLISWVEAMIILFLLQYIIQILMLLGKVLTDITYKVKLSLVDAGKESFEQNLINNLVFRMFTISGAKAMVTTIMFCCLAFTHLRFFLLYIKRSITLGFLIIISPFITVTYPIDKMGDNKAQAFEAWLQEMIIHIFIQPLHAIIYTIFAFSAGEIVNYAPILGLLFFMAIPSAEKMIRNVFNMHGSKVLGDLHAYGMPKGKK